MKIRTSLLFPLPVPSLLVFALLASLPLCLHAQVTLSVSSSMDIYQAGGYNDGSGGLPPAAYTFPATTGRIINFPSTTGTWTCQSNLPYYTADGTYLAGNCRSGEHHIDNPVGTLSGFSTSDFAGALVGVFLEDFRPVSAPAPLRFYIINGSFGGIKTNFTTLSPQIGQVFFIGDGKTGTDTGALQNFVVPSAATHLYLGYLDSCNDTVPGCFGDNAGSISVSIAAESLLGMCPTGQTRDTPHGCSGQLITPNPPGGGTNRDPNWELAYLPPGASIPNPCAIPAFLPAYVDTPNHAWLPNPASYASEWVSSFDGEDAVAPGWYIYRIRFRTSSSVHPNPVLRVNGRLASDDQTFGIFVESPAGSGYCALVSGQAFPVNPGGNTGSDFGQWWPFSFTNSQPLVPAEPTYLYVVVKNSIDPLYFRTPSGLRVEFFGSSFR